MVTLLVQAAIAIVAWEIGIFLYYYFFHNHKDDEWKPNPPTT